MQNQPWNPKREVAALKVLVCRTDTGTGIITMAGRTLVLGCLVLQHHQHHTKHPVNEIVFLQTSSR